MFARPLPVRSVNDSLFIFKLPPWRYPEAVRLVPEAFVKESPWSEVLPETVR